MSYLHVRFSVGSLVATILSGLGLVACGDGALGDQPTLRGPLTGWDRGLGFALHASANGSKILASSGIDLSGNFTLTLPDGATMAPYLKKDNAMATITWPGCTGSLMNDQPEVTSATLILDAVSGSNRIRVSQQNGAQSPSFFLVNYVYADRDANLSGQIDCPTPVNGVIQKSWDIHYRLGWNRVITAQLSMPSGTLKEYSGGLPDGVKWVTQ